MIEIGIADWLILAMWVVVVGIIIVIKNIVWKSPFSKFLFPAYLIKIMGGVAFVLVYHYYYGGGDTSYYFMGANNLSDVFFESPANYFKLLFSSPDEAQELLHRLGKGVSSAEASEEWFMVRLVSPFTVLGMKSFLGTTFFLSLFSLLGSWKLFKLMNQIVPNKKRTLFAINFLVPSVVFWGSGIMKDTVTMSCFFIILCWFYQLLYERNNSLGKIAGMLILMYIVFSLKAYILLGALPWFFVTLFLFFSNKMPSVFLKITIIPFLLVVLSVSAFFVSRFAIESSAKYNTDNIFNNIRGFHSWHTTLGGSSYTLGEMEYTFSGLLVKAPAAINVTLFRPYLWEADSAFVLLSGIESFLFLCLTIWTLFKSKFRPFKRLFHSPFLTGGFLFCVIFAFSIGLTAYNFGALVRFKIPMMGIYLFILLYIVTQSKAQQIKNRN